MDLKDSGGRLKRIGLALGIAAGCTAAAYFIANAIVEPDKQAYVEHVSTRQMDAGTFVVWVALVTFAISLAGSLGILNTLAKKKWLASQSKSE